MGVIGIWHTSFTVSNLDESVSFYCGLLGLELVHRQTQQNEYTSRLVGFEDAHLEVAMLSIPGVDPGPSGHHLELVQYLNPLGEPLEVKNNQPGAPHLAFVVQNIHLLFNKLHSKGVKFRSDKPIEIMAGRNKGGYTIYFSDPDGITLELVQPPQSQ